MKNLCFVIMPFGEKTDADGTVVHFDEVYSNIIEKAVESVGDLECVRSDKIQEAGWIHERMLRHIFDDRVAIVDTSTLNANVFYELGVRHALKESVTVLIHRKGTSWPFNIGGLSSITYETTPEGIAEAIETIRAYIVNGLNNPDNIDSLVYKAIPSLRPQRKPIPLTQVTVTEYSLRKKPERKIALITGDRQDIRVCDIWVNSENTNMQMDKFYGTSTSAQIRFLGAAKNKKGKIEEDTIADALAKEMSPDLEVDPGVVLVTGAGALSRNNNVKWIFHVAAVDGVPRQGYKPVSQIDQCVKNALRKAEEPEYGEARSILFPIFGTGPAGGDLLTHAETCINAAVEHLESADTNPITSAYFYCWSDVTLDVCRTVARNHRGLQSA